MKICVFGLWHLGTVTAACLAEAEHEVIAIDPEISRVKQLNEGTAPLFEPGLNELISTGLAKGNIRFSNKLADAGEADIAWATFDTPVDDEDNADTHYVSEQIGNLLPHLRDGAVLIVSSQLPVGSIGRIEEEFRQKKPGRAIWFACSPENLRLGKAIESFRSPDRIVVGTNNDTARAPLASLFSHFSDEIIWTSLEAAEISKHAINGFLATSIVFINEIASICELFGADVREVERALRSEPRIGPKAYIRPGGAFAGGTLARDLTFLRHIADANELPLTMLRSVAESNKAHRQWPLKRMSQVLQNGLSGKKIAVLGLTYKPGTDTLRRSESIVLCRKIVAEGGRVAAYDPRVASLPPTLGAVTLAASTEDALRDADAAVVMTEWPEFKELAPDQLINLMRNPIVFDQNDFLDHLTADRRISQYTVGRRSYPTGTNLGYKEL